MWLPCCSSISYPTLRNACKASLPDTAGNFIAGNLDDFLDYARRGFIMLLQAL